MGGQPVSPDILVRVPSLYSNIGKNPVLDGELLSSARCTGQYRKYSLL